MIISKLKVSLFGRILIPIGNIEAEQRHDGCRAEVSLDLCRTQIAPRSIRVLSLS
jgi:hypothetical protein